MAVYTEVTDEQVSDFISNYDIGDFIRVEAIQSGIENSNYHLFTTKNRYILTIYEKRVNPDDLPFFYDYKEHLASHGIICPRVIPTVDGNRVGKLCGKAAAVVSFLDGGEVAKDKITPDICNQLGKEVAKMHVASMEFKQTRKNSMGLAEWNSLFNEIREEADKYSDGLEKFLSDELEYLNNNHPSNLPSCVCHVDMFPDNIFFKDGNMYGFIDFYYSCSSSMIYDFILTVNGWCFDENNEFVRDRFRGFIVGYQSVRKLEQIELDAITYMGRAVSMRLIATRLYDWINTPEGSLVVKKDPMECIKMLRFYHENELLGRDAPTGNLLEQV